MDLLTIVGWVVVLACVVVLNIKIWHTTLFGKVKLPLFRPWSMSAWVKNKDDYHYYVSVYDGKSQKHYIDGVQMDVTVMKALFGRKGE